MLEDRFWSKVDKSGDCWNWVAGKHKDGYGHIKVNGKMVLAHRLVLELEGVDIPSGMCVCHTCDNPACVNPDHLWLGTHEQNMLDRDAKGRRIIKLTADDAEEIRALRGEMSQYKIAEKYGVTQSLVSQIHRGLIWREREHPKKEHWEMALSVLCQEQS